MASSHTPIPPYPHTLTPSHPPIPQFPNSPCHRKFMLLSHKVGTKAAMVGASHAGTRWRSSISPGFFIRRWLRLPGHCRSLKFLLPPVALRGNPSYGCRAEFVAATFRLRIERVAREVGTSECSLLVHSNSRRNLKVEATRRGGFQNGQKIGMNTTARPQKIRLSGIPTFM